MAVGGPPSGLLGDQPEHPQTRLVLFEPRAEPGPLTEDGLVGDLDPTAVANDEPTGHQSVEGIASGLVTIEGDIDNAKLAADVEVGARRVGEIGEDATGRRLEFGIER